MTDNLEKLEVKEDSNVPKSPLTVFVATLPDNMNRNSTCLKEIEKIKDIIILHPYYDFKSEVGKATLDLIGDMVPEYDNVWETAMRRDLFCIDKSDIVVFDLDTPDISHYLAMAVCYNKPIIAVSSTLLSVPVYFSGSVSCIIKPKQIANILTLSLADENFLKLPQQTNLPKEETLLDSKYQDAVRQIQEKIDASWEEKDAEFNKESIESTCDGDNDSKIQGRKKTKRMGTGEQETGEVRQT